MATDFSKRCWFTFPTKTQVEQPIIWQMSRKFPDVVFDIRQASVQNEIGIMAALLSGGGEGGKGGDVLLRCPRGVGGSPPKRRGGRGGGGRVSAGHPAA